MYPKCKYCNEVIIPSEKVILIEKTKKGKDRKINLHTNCKNDYYELMEYKNKEIRLFDELYEYIKELLGYTSEQFLPKSLITRLRDLRNGTIMKRGIGRVVKSKEGYGYDVIYNTFLSNGDEIRWILSNKNFKNEAKKINYIMAMIDNKINDSYMELMNKNQNEIIKKRNNLLEDDIKDRTYVTNVTRKPEDGIKRFLEEDDLF